MKTLKFFTVILMLSISGIAFGQFTVGGKAGANFSNMSMKGNYESDVELKSKLGFNFGLYGEYAFNEKISIQVAIMSVGKGTKYESDGVKYKIAINSYELQPNLIYTLHAGKTPIFIAAGPYFTLFATGTLKADKAILGQNGDSKTTSFDLGNDKENDNMKASDYGINIAAGLSLNEQLGRLGLQYGLGLANLALDTENDSSIKNSSISLFWSYPFGFGKKKK